jgi:hypothetical protein
LVRFEELVKVLSFVVQCVLAIWASGTASNKMLGGVWEGAVGWRCAGETAAVHSNQHNRNDKESRDEPLRALAVRERNGETRRRRRRRRRRRVHRARHVEQLILFFSLSCNVCAGTNLWVCLCVL